MVHRRVKGGQFKIKHVQKLPLVEVGEELDVHINGLCPNGDGMSNIRGYIIQVPKAKPRDHVKVRITQVGEKLAIGEIIK